MKENTAQSALSVAMQEILSQGESLLLSLSDEQYTYAHPQAFNASVGAHYRHCLEHFEALLTFPEGGRVDYDARKRDRSVETDRHVALERTRKIREHIGDLPVDSYDREVEVCCRVTEEEGRNPMARSSLGREAMYGIIHAVHHFALIKVMAGLAGVSLPDNFGVAPSTAAHRRKELASSG